MAYATIDKPSSYFNTKLYTGNGGSSQSITGVGFQPDFVWIKDRPLGFDHNLFDSVRGIYKALFSNNDYVENFGQGSNTDSLTSFDSDGFSVGGDDALNDAYTYVSWNWKAGGTAVSNTSGTITSSVSASTTSGFSIVSYTGNGTSGATVGHGLGVAPKIIIVKNRTRTDAWPVDVRFASGILYLNETGTLGSYGAIEPYTSTAPTSTVFSLGSAGNTNFNTSSLIAYCFAEVKGYSKFGSYVGNGNADGTFVYTGFKPAMIIRRRRDGVQDWLIQDNKRTGINQTTSYTSILKPNSSTSELGFNEIDILSNGFKCRASDTHGNASGGNYIYMAFAENPFVSSKGIPTTAR